MTRTITFAVIIVFTALFAACENVQDIFAVQKPKASLQGLKFEEVGLEAATLLFDVKIENPYPVALPLLNIDYDVESGANKLFSGEADIQTSIAAKESKTVSLPVRISYLDMVKAFKGIRPGTKIPYKAVLGLSVDAQTLGELRLHLNKTGEVAVPSVPKINEIDWRGLIDKAGQL